MGDSATGQKLLLEPPCSAYCPSACTGPASWDPAEIEVAFTEVEGGTEVPLEHRGLDTLPPDAADRIRRGYPWNVALRWVATQWT